MVDVTFSKNEPWSVSIVGINTGSRSSGLVQCWEEISPWYVDRLTAVVATVTVTAAVTVSSYSYRYSSLQLLFSPQLQLEFQLQLETKDSWGRSHPGGGTWRGY